VRLRAKTLLIVVVTLGGLSLLLLLAARALVVQSFDAIEADAVRQNLERASRALAEEVVHLERTTQDYAAWDETYRFAEDRHPEYLALHLPTEDAAQLHVRVIAVLDLAGTLLHQRLLDFENKRQLTAPPALIEPFLDRRLLAPDPEARRGRSGVLILPDSEWLVASWPILDNTRSRPARGTIVMGRPLDAATVRGLAETTHLDLEIRRLAAPAVAPELGADGTAVTPLSEQEIRGEAVVRDVHGQPALLLSIRMPRSIHQSARNTLAYFSMALAFVGLVFGASMLGLIQASVLSRLQRLATSLQAIRAEKRLATRVDASGQDEIADLGAAINGLLETIDGSQRALQRSEERYALAAHAANDGLWDWHVPAEEAYFSPRWKEMLGYTEAEIAARPDEWLVRVHPEDQAGLRAALDSASEVHAEHEHRVLHKDGAHRHVLSRWVTVRGADGAVERRVGSMSDITARKQAEQKLRHEALYDALTGLPNRALLLDRLRQALARMRRHPDRVCGLLFLDVDRFKVINDSLGHGAGDHLLREVARRIERSVRPEDTVARLGGDEFTVLLDSVHGPTDASHAAGRIQSEIAGAFRLGDVEVYTSVSIGIAISTAAYQKPEELIRDADTAMYRAKAAGKARHEVFDSGMHAQAMSTLKLENDLRRALERSEFEVYYQPIVRLEQQPDIVGFEALVRWRHPERGLVLPGEFIPLAEETGLIVPLGRWVLERACQESRDWPPAHPERSPLTLCVNLSARQLVEADFLEAVEGTLARTGFPASRLHLEITESVIMQQPELFTVKLSQLKDLGVRVSIDDFGTGYSSLSYLHLFPVDSLKIDRTFVSSMQSLGKQKRIIETIVMLAHNLGIDVIAEGVEGEDQRQALRQLGCGLAQGFLFSKPVDAASARQLVESEQALGGPEAGGVTGITTRR